MKETNSGVAIKQRKLVIRVTVASRLARGRSNKIARLLTYGPPSMADRPPFGPLLLLRAHVRRSRA
jgi:hypothetical protein